MSPFARDGRRAVIGIASALMLVLATLGFTSSAQAQTAQRLTVDTTADTVDASPGDGSCADDAGACSLRAAVQEATASGEPTQITLPAGRYTFTQANADGDEEASVTGDLDISTDVRITGFGATLDLDWLDRGFDVTPDGELLISGLEIVNGYAKGGDDPIVGSGGAIANAGTTTVQLASFVGNRAEGPAASGGAILNTGDLTVRFSTFDANRATRAGGAIEANGGTTTVVESTFNENTTGAEPGNGGAFHLSGEGQVMVDSSTFTANTATAEGGALWNSAGGTMTIVDSVITGNVASGAEADQGGGGLYNDGGTMIVEGSTLAGNIADGAAGSGGGILNNAGTLEVTDTTLTNNISNRAGGGIEANVGTTTLTGVELESNATGPAPGNGGGLHITGAGDATITASKVMSNIASAEGGGLWNGTGTMTVTDSVIMANSAGGAEADQGGGGLFNAGGTLIVDGGAVIGNTANGDAGSGGGILNDQGTLTVSDTSIVSNSSNRAGGGIEANIGTTNLDGVYLLRNTTGPVPGNGGGLHITGPGDATIADATVLFNTAAAEGGGLWNGGGTMDVTDSHIAHNVASGADANQGGGGLFNAGGTLNVTNSVVTDNVADGASGSGGGVLNDMGDLTVTDSVIERNESNRAGGGIEAVGGAEESVGSNTVVDTSLAFNSTGDAPGNGGGFHLSATSTVDIDGGQVIFNFASNEGGGLWNSATGTMSVDGVDVDRNTSPVGADLFTQPGGNLLIDQG